MSPIETLEDAEAVLWTIERELARHRAAYGERSPTALVVLPRDGIERLVRLDDVARALHTLRDLARCNRVTSEVPDHAPLRDAILTAIEDAPRTVPDLIAVLRASEAGVRRAVRRLHALGCISPHGTRRTARRGYPATLWSAC